MSPLSSFYSDPQANCVFLSLLTSLSWSMTDLQSGVNAAAGTDMTLIAIVYGVTFFALAVLVAVCDATEAAAPLRHWPEALAFVALGLCGIVDNYVYIYAQKMIPVGDVAVLSNLSFIYTSIMDSLLRRRFPSGPQFLGILASSTGVVLVTQPSFLFGTPLDVDDAARQLTGHLCGLATGAALTVDAMLVSAFKEIPLSNWMLSVSVALFGCGAVGAAVNGDVAVASGPLIGVSLVAMSMFSAVGQFSSVLSTKSHTPTLMALVTVLQVPLSYAWGWIWLGQVMNYVKIAGVVMVCSAVTVVIVEARQKEEEKYVMLPPKNQ